MPTQSVSDRPSAMGQVQSASSVNRSTTYTHSRLRYYNYRTGICSFHRDMEDQNGFVGKDHSLRTCEVVKNFYTHYEKDAWF